MTRQISKKNLAIPAEMVTHLETGSHFLNDGNDIGGLGERKKKKRKGGANTVFNGAV